MRLHVTLVDAALTAPFQPPLPRRHDDTTTRRHDDTNDMAQMELATHCPQRNCSEMRREQVLEEKDDLPTPTLPPSFLKGTKITGQRRAREECDAADVQVEAEERILAAVRSAIERESENIDVKEHSLIVDAFLAQRQRGKKLKSSSSPSSVVQSSEKIMELLFDVKEKLTTKEYLALLSECQTVHDGEASITIGRGRDGRERTLYKSSFEKITDFNAKLNLARELHPRISRLFKTLEDLQRNPEVDISFVKDVKQELNELRNRHSRLLSEADLYFNVAIHDPMFELVYYGSLNFAYLFKLYELRMTAKRNETQDGCT